jgi:YggT family protein
LAPAEALQGRSQARGRYLGSAPQTCQAARLAEGRPDWQNGANLKARPERQTPMLDPISSLLLLLLDLYWWIVIAAVVMSWLIAFNVVNLHNNIVRSLVRLLDVLTEPVFRQVRRIIPVFSGIDISPLFVLIAIWFLQQAVVWVAWRAAF